MADSGFADTIRDALEFLAGEGDRDSFREDEGRAALAALAGLEAELARVKRERDWAVEHIRDDLQPEFQRLADGLPLSWPFASEPYDRSVAAQRLATWWHGVDVDESYVGARASALAARLETTQAALTALNAAALGVTRLPWPGPYAYEADYHQALLSLAAATDPDLARPQDATRGPSTNEGA